MTQEENQALCNVFSVMLMDAAQREMNCRMEIAMLRGQIVEMRARLAPAPPALPPAENS